MPGLLRANDRSEGYNPRFSWPAVLAVFTGIGVLRFTTFYLDDLTRQLPGTLPMRLLEEGTGAYGALLLFPLFFLLERRYPLTAGRWRRTWAVHLAGWIAYSLLHTTVMWMGRTTIHSALGYGPYDYGRMSIRYFMESPNDLFAYCAFLGVMSLLRVMHTVRERDLRVAALARTAAESKLVVLSTRLQPHFLFNSLNTIASAVYDDPEAADAMIGHLGDLLRHALRTSQSPEDPLSDELEVLQSYLAIVRARFGERVTFELEVDPATTSLAVPALLLQPLVENAVRHGAGVEYPSAVTIRIRRADDALHIAIENEIPSGEPADAVPGTGLSTTRDRLRLLYGDGHAFVARATGRRFEVQLSIPARRAEAVPSGPRSLAHAGADR